MQTAYPSTPTSGCGTSLDAGSFGSTTSSALSRIPARDLYGNRTNTGNYIYSHYTNPAGATITPNPVYDGVPFNGYTAAGAKDNYIWGLAFWDATGDAARRIRTDANFTNRAGDRSA